jgi:hypothetical protein
LGPSYNHRMSSLAAVLLAFLTVRGAIPEQPPDDPAALAWAARPLDPAILDQTRYLATAGGSVTAAEQAQYETAGHVDEAVIRDIADWIKK